MKYGMVIHFEKKANRLPHLYMLDAKNHNQILEEFCSLMKAFSSV